MDRDVALDRFRGIAVILMVLGDNIANVPDLPDFIKHAPDIGFTFADIVAPVFIFAIAMTYKPSFMRRFDKSRSGAYGHYVYKYLALIGLGTIFSAGGAVVAQEMAWGVLQAIGVACLVALLFVKLPAWVRAVSALGILAAYQFILDRCALEAVLSSSHGGFIGSLSWAGMLILSTAMVDWFAQSKPRFLLYSGLLALLSLGSLLVVPISKNRLSLSYVLISVTICCAAYYVVDALTRRVKMRPGLICFWGENPLLLYILHLLLLALLQVPLALLNVDPMPLWYGALTSVVLFAGLSFLVLTIHRKKIFIKL